MTTLENYGQLTLFTIADCIDYGEAGQAYIDRELTNHLGRIASTEMRAAQESVIRERLQREVLRLQGRRHELPHPAYSSHN